MNAIRIRERDLAVLVSDFLAWALPSNACYLRIPNERIRPAPGELRALCRRGLMPGAPDLFVFSEGRARGIELKAHADRLSAEQRLAHETLGAAGVEVHVCRSLEQVITSLGGFVELREAVDAAGF